MSDGKASDVTEAMDCPYEGCLGEITGVQQAYGVGVVARGGQQLLGDVVFELHGVGQLDGLMCNLCKREPPATPQNGEGE